MIRNIDALFPYGSMVYGTNRPGSDADFIIVTDLPGQSGTFSNMDVQSYSHQEFRDMLDACNIVALECVMQDLPQSANFPYTINPWKLRQSCSAIASNAWVKCKKKMAQGDDYIGKKSVWHSLRILNFGIQILVHGKIIDYGAVNFMYDDIMKMKTWEEIDKKYRSISKQMQTDFRQLAPKE